MTTCCCSGDRYGGGEPYPYSGSGECPAGDCVYAYVVGPGAAGPGYGVVAAPPVGLVGYGIDAGGV